MSNYIIRGHVHKYGDNINTDIISPAQYMELSYHEIAMHAMETIDADFFRKVKPGDIVVAGKNFGSGSSRETAPIALKYAGVGLVIAESFARIFYRNSFNIGLPVFELNSVEDIQNGDELEVNLMIGKIKNISLNKEYSIPPLSKPILELLQDGGLIARLEKICAKANS